MCRGSRARWVSQAPDSDPKVLGSAVAWPLLAAELSSALAFPLDLGARPLYRRLRGRGCANCFPSSADLYSGWLAEALGSTLQVQFWQRSSGILPSNCSGAQHVFDVTQTAFPGPAGPAFNATEDHSKWCVSSRERVNFSTRQLGLNHRLAL